MSKRLKFQQLIWLMRNNTKRLREFLNTNLIKPVSNNKKSKNTVNF